MNKEFTSHRLNPEGFKKAQAIGGAFDTLLNQLTEICKGQTGREFAIARTKLEEACFFAKKAMACIPENQEAVVEPPKP